MLATAVGMPPHARVNGRCYAMWNDDHSDLRLVWRGTTYEHGFHVVSWTPDWATYTSSWWSVQHLLCTDSGAVGFYCGPDEDYNQNQCVLDVSWLGHADTTYQRVLGTRDGNDEESWFGVVGAGPLTVAASTVFYYTHATGYSRHALPRLNSLVFGEWCNGADGEQLVSEGLRAYSVLGYGGATRWTGRHSPLYPSGPSTVTLSVNDDWRPCTEDGGWTVDAVVDGAAGRTVVRVHSSPRDVPSSCSASREVASFPGYSCRAQGADGVVCAALAEGFYTWAERAQETLGMRFLPLHATFALPHRVWLLAHCGGSAPFLALAGQGHAPVLGVAGDTLVGVVTRPDARCASGSRLFLARFALPGSAELGAEPLNCEWRQIAPVADDY